MNPGDVVTLGPIVLALDRVVALGMMLLFLWACDWILRRNRVDRASLSWWALAAGMIGARAGHVIAHWQSFALDPFEVLRVWLGGWHWPSGLVAALAVLGARLGRSRAMGELAAVLVVLGAVWAGFVASRNDDPALRLPQTVVLHKLDGRQATLADYRGRPVILNLWATWCPPCRRETPMLVRMASAPGPIPIVLVNQGEQREAVVRYLASEGLSAGPVVLDPEGTLSQMTGSKALPTTLLVGPDGTVRAVHMGEVSRVQIDIMMRAAQH